MSLGMGELLMYLWEGIRAKYPCKRAIRDISRGDPGPWMLLSSSEFKKLAI